MVRSLRRENTLEKLKSFSAKAMFDLTGRKAHSLVAECVTGGSETDDRMASRSHGSRPSTDNPLERQQIGWALSRTNTNMKSRLSRNGGGEGPKAPKPKSDLEMMKEKYSKLLLGEDMSGRGKGVSSALALSNAITNLAASVFGEQYRLEPMSPERKTRWRREIDWLLSVTDHIVEFVASQQTANDGTNMDIMVTRQRTDLLMNIPALRKLDAMLLDYLDNFKDQNEFTYVSRDSEEAEKGRRTGEKWWLPVPKVPPNGLSEVSRKWIQFQKESVNQVLKAAMAINAQVLSEMQIPDSYLETLPKNGKACLGDTMYRGITDEFFDPGQILSTQDLSTEHKVLDLKNRLEASIVIWKRKMNNKDSKSSWGTSVSLEKRELFEERAETLLIILKHRFPGIPQSNLDISKIQYNRVCEESEIIFMNPLKQQIQTKFCLSIIIQDVGQSILESYSRILESLAYTVISRIEDVLHADSLARNPTQSQPKSRPLSIDTNSMGTVKLDATEELEKLNMMEVATSMTLSDFMGWQLDQEENEEKDDSTTNRLEVPAKDDKKIMTKLANIVTNKKVSYIEKLGGLRSPTSRH
ncbi:hypothetical protein Scep_007520 [Stephania cephalantha]|uniref:PRONE domain-containing protein n=1 Tax=Stephania cephalantha TaxID=152367 RepID=A0AAP0PL75_9MAGN